MSARYLGDSKIDLPAGQIFSKWASGISEERGLVAAYAAKDTLLPVKLLEKLCIFENTREMANATSCPMSWIFRRGQQIKVFSQLLRTGRAMGIVFPDGKGVGLAPGTKFAGAVVLDAKKGAYFDIVSGLDFASLYPSIIRAHNMSPDTLVMSDKYGAIEGVEYYEIETDQGTFKFAQQPMGVLPKLLEDLAAFRKKAKKDMADAKKRGDTFAYNLFNAKQLAFKISMNSAYGFFGASKGFLPCVPISASVTATGRKMIEKTKFLAETLVPGSNVVYGDTDSVMVILDLGPEKRHDMKAHFEAAAKVADEISKTFQHPIELEFEKCYYPYLLYSKKRYAGRMFSSSPDKPDYVDVKGLALVRRDFAPIVKTSSETVLKKLMDEQDPEGAIATARDAVLSVLDAPPGCDMTPFIMSKTLRGSYKNTAQPHLFVAKRIHERTGEPVPSGARVPYVFTQRADETLLGTKSGQAEDPMWAKDHGMELDKLYYVRNQLMTPLVSMLEVIDDNVEKKIFTPDIVERLDALERGVKAEVREQKRLKFVKDNKLRPITDFFKKK
jgi:DNA polymerase delta subunit 1